MKKLLPGIFIFFFLFLAALIANGGDHNSNMSLSSAYSDSTSPPTVTYKVFNDPAIGYGYDILLNGKMIVHQSTIPCIAGNRGFANFIDAKKTARLVVQKVQKGILPPTIAISEMKKLGIRLK